MALATLSIDLEARLANFEANLGQATRLLDGFVSKANGAFAGVGAVFSGSLLASGFEEGIRRIVDLFPQLVDGVARFQDIAEETNGSAVGFASMATAADVAGVSVEALAGLSVKLTTNLAKANDEGKGVGLALRALGVDLKTFRELRPDEQIAKLAETFETFEDSSAKTAIAVALMGKSGAQFLKFAKEYQREGGNLVRLTDEQIRTADAFADSQTRARSALRQTAEQIAISAIPAMTALTSIAHDLIGQIVGVGAAGRTLKTDMAILDWAETAAVGVGAVAEALIGVTKLARSVGGSFQAVAADIALPFKVAGELGAADGRSISQRLIGVGKAFAERDATVREANQRYVDLWSYDGTAVTRAIRDSFDQQRAEIAKGAAGNAAAEDSAPKKRLETFVIPERNPNADKAERAGEELLARISERTAAAQIELNTGEKQSEADAFAADVRSKLAKVTGDLTAAQRGRIESALAEYLTVGKANERQREAMKLREAESRALAADLSTREAANRALADSNAEIGLNADALDDLRIARMENAVAIAQERIETLALFGADEDAMRQQRDRLDAMREELRLRREGVEIKRAQRADGAAGVDEAIGDYARTVHDKFAQAKGATRDAVGALEDDLAQSFRKGEFTAKRFADTVIDHMMRIQVVRPMLNWLFGDGGSNAGAIGGALKFMFAGASANGNAWAGGARIQAFANGGIFGPGGGLMTAPTMFSTRAGLALGGEAGTEAVLPLARGAGGKLGVMLNGSRGGTQVVHQTFNVGAGVSRPEVMALMQSYGQQLKGEILSSMRNGGAFAAA